jgi:hypothetical protein
MWNRQQFESAAQEIGNTHTSSGGAQSVNDLALKLAQHNGLNPEGIRTLVRLSNVAVFENMFGKAASEGAPDRMFNFTVGDPEQVISQLGGLAQADTSGLGKVASDESYDRALDYYGSMKQAPLTKTASETVHIGVERAVGPDVHPVELKAMFKRAGEIMRDQQRQAEIAWGDKLEKAAQLMRVTYVGKMAVDNFEKNAVAALGADVLPELKMLRHYNSMDMSAGLLGDPEKVAHVIEYHVSVQDPECRDILNLVKTARADRETVQRLAVGIENAVKMAPKVG